MMKFSMKDVFIWGAIILNTVMIGLLFSNVSRVVTVVASHDRGITVMANDIATLSCKSNPNCHSI